MRTNSKLTKKSKIRRIAQNILFSLIVFLLFILVLEIVLRTTHLFGARLAYSEPCPILGYRFTPSRKYWYNKENDHPITGRINSYAWRDKEWSIRKPQDTYRIAVLGDSFVQAFQVESDRTFLALTENKLNEDYNLKVELMNFGLGGATQTEELLILKNDIVQFSPDMVLLFFCPLNDIRDVSRETAQQIMRPFYNISENGELILVVSFHEMRAYKVRCFINLFKQHSALISLLCERFSAYQQGSGSEAASGKIEGFLSLCTDNPDATYLKNYHLNKTLINAMSEHCKAKRIRFMIVCLDTSAHLPENEEKYATLDSTFNANFFEDDLKIYAKVLNVEYLGLQRIFSHSYECSRIPLHWDHWNYEGHEVVANALANKLKSIIESNENDEE
jgi:hypothetical protein